MHRFLAAEWRYLAMLNYPVEAQVLQPLVPAGTELDTWNGTPYVSMVGFLFLNTRVLGAAIPFHTNFEEVNLRFYVRRKAEDGWRRGVVFVHEIVPRWAIAFVARTVYNEKYLSMPMHHHFGSPGQPEASAPSQDGRPAAARSATQAADSGPLTVEYGWRFHGHWNRLALTTCGAPALAREGSEEQFITEHYWGYAATGVGGAIEYRVEHPSWQVWQAQDALLECEVSDLYGPQFQDSLSARPTSAFLARGSPVVVYQGKRLTV